MNFNNLFIKTIRTRSQLLNYQTVRWRRPRKPFWLGLAKSKMFIIREPKIKRTPEEKVEVNRLTFHYSTAYKSLLKFIQTDNPALKNTVFLEGNKVDSSLIERMSESMRLNESWNAESERRRNSRAAKDMELQMEKAIKELDEHEEMRMKKMELIEEIVKKEKVLSAHYITPDNLDEAIENCLNKVECFDFAIDLQGNRYHGRESLPPSGTIKQETPVENVS